MPKLFLKARWEHLILVTYKVDPDILTQYLPKGLELDTIDGDAFVSVVGFNFHDTTVKGLRVPFHVNFPEINLRFYVKQSSPPDPSPSGRGESNAEKFEDISPSPFRREDRPACRSYGAGRGEVRRGVVFIREFVPRYFISLFANLFYNENYRSVSMNSELKINDDKIYADYGINLNGKFYNISIEAENKTFKPSVNSTEHYFKEHEWGFGATRKRESLVYRVEHPNWEVYPIISFNNTIDFGLIYGKKWHFLNNEKPYNIAFAKGSPVKVFSAEKLLY
ncbi:MAG TPA: DUF2071 domain-containing protein [Ignavibacteria bacterium]|nr:DUF2071 domain-containing protein [Ignavibacteria bacterium]